MEIPEGYRSRAIPLTLGEGVLSYMRTDGPRRSNALVFSPTRSTVLLGSWAVDLAFLSYLLARCECAQAPRLPHVLDSIIHRFSAVKDGWVYTGNMYRAGNSNGMLLYSFINSTIGSIKP